MPLYTFTANAGTELDKFYHMADAPKFGAVLVEDGVKYRRRPMTPRVTVQKTSIVASSLPRWDKRAKRHTKDGKPAFESKNEIREYEARSEKDWTWD